MSERQFQQLMAEYESSPNTWFKGLPRREKEVVVLFDIVKPLNELGLEEVMDVCFGCTMPSPMPNKLQHGPCLLESA